MRLSLSYTFKRLIRSWRLFIALLLGIVLAATFFAGINVGADTAAKQALDQALERVPVDFFVSGYSPLSSSNVKEIAANISGVEGVVETEVISRTWGEALSRTNYPYNFRLVGISNKSRVYQGWFDPPSSLEENKTYVLTDSPESFPFQEDDIIQVNMTVSGYRPEFQTMVPLSFTVNLTVEGFAKLDTKASTIAYGYYSGFYGSPFTSYGESLLLVGWENTLARFLDAFYEASQSLSSDILVYVDRNSLISVWDIPNSLQRLDVVKRNIDQVLLQMGKYDMYAYGTLDSVLRMSQFTFSAMRLSFIVVSLPVFFVAWYMGTTVSDVSFNLRRREIGLMLTKGFSRRQLLRIFLTEAFLIGLAGGIVGIALSLALNPLFVRAVGGEFIGTPLLGIDTAILTVVFSVVITLLVVFRPARRASNLAAVDALREYMYVEEVKPYKRLWPWVAFILGAYKLVIFLLGVNLLAEVGRLAMSGGNFLIIILAGMWAFFDFFVLTYIGPVLFFWGFTKIFIRGSLKFQEVMARAAKFLGDLGVLATRNVQRNPARAASVAFLIALIIGYGVQITGILASDQDYNIRTVYANVGADVSVALASPLNVSASIKMMDTIRNNVSGVASTTLEYSFYGTSSFGGLQMKAVNTNEWLNTAYYEAGWFSGNDVKTAFQLLSSSNDTIILDLDIAETNNLKVGRTISVSFDRGIFGEDKNAKDLAIVGFFGAKRPQGTFFGQIGTFQSWSYVSEGLFQELSPVVQDAASARILVKLNSGADGTAVANEIRGLITRNVGSVYSVSEQLQEQQSDFMYVGTLNVQRLGVAFAILATSVGTALVTLVSLKERQREASIMGVRGLSFKQLTIMLLTENLAVVTFAVLLGFAAGLIVIHGNAASFNSATPSIIAKRLVFPTDALLTIFAYFGLVFASTIVPVVFMARRYVSRLERVVRQV